MLPSKLNGTSYRFTLSYQNINYSLSSKNVDKRGKLFRIELQNIVQFKEPKGSSTCD